MTQITVQTTVNADINTVWDAWTDPENITKWAFASDDWEAPRAENDLRVGGTFTTRMQAKDGSSGFDFSGTYTTVSEKKLIEYKMTDGRHVATTFEETDDGVVITTTFDAETENSEEVQRQGWQAILDNFKKYVEG